MGNQLVKSQIKAY